MMRLLAMLLVAMIVSGYYFPFTFSFLPGSEYEDGVGGHRHRLGSL